MVESSSDVPDRHKALVMGIVGGIVGAVAMRYYTRKTVPRILLHTPFVTTEPAKPDPQESHALIPRQYEDGETPFQAAGRITYATITGDTSEAAEKRYFLGDIVEWCFLIAAGAAYGGTRTTTRYRDIAGSFFMGLRMWSGEEIIAPVLGLRAGFTRFTPEQHVVLLSAYWVFTFVMAHVTRVLYRLL